MAQDTPQVKKIRDLRSTGMSLREIAEKLNIQRSAVEEVLNKFPAKEETKAENKVRLEKEKADELVADTKAETKQQLSDERAKNKKRIEAATSEKKAAVKEGDSENKGK